MKKAAVSEFKSKLSTYLRLVRAGERIEIQDRGVPVAILSGIATGGEVEILIIPPRADPKSFAKLKSKVKLKTEVDVVQFLIEDRRRR